MEDENTSVREPTSRKRQLYGWEIIPTSMHGGTTFFGRKVEPTIFLTYVRTTQKNVAEPLLWSGGP